MGSRRQTAKKPFLLLRAYKENDTFQRERHVPASRDNIHQNKQRLPFPSSYKTGIESQGKPPTVMIPTVKVTSLRHASLTYGPAQAAVAKAIMQCIEDGIIPNEIIDDIVMIVNVFVHPSATARKRVFINNYKATRNAIRKAIEDLPTVQDGIENAESARHPLRNDP